MSTHKRLRELEKKVETLEKQLSYFTSDHFTVMLKSAIDETIADGLEVEARELTTDEQIEHLLHTARSI